jgi:hypothetical protein
MVTARWIEASWTGCAQPCDAPWIATLCPKSPCCARKKSTGPARRGDGTLDATGRATLPLKDSQRGALTESAAWDHDWSMTSVVVGADTAESPEIRERVRRWARARLNLPPRDAFLAEILASESAY